MSPTSIDATGLPFFKVNNTKSPCEGPIAIPFILDFSVNPEYSINLQNAIDLQRISIVQAVFLDNSGSSDALVVSSPVTGQQISCPGNSQGYFSITCPNPASLIFTSASSAKLFIEILNYPVNTATWKVA